MNDEMKVSKAFEELKTKGYFTGERMPCCMSCALDEIPPDTEKYVFYHDQDYEAFDNFGNLDSTLYLGWQGDGNDIISAIKNQGFVVEWDGNPGTRIGVNKK